ncbi:hypothetical protein [Robbsia sp. KACC 23696]|uniref:hypothetical protein n=1 Tax=Robbsia sp. KACC 23696 TaxID=3149231 RepID=UPI00325BFF01
MYQSVTPQLQEDLDQINIIVARNAHDPRVAQAIAQLQQVSADVAKAAISEAELQTRSAANVISDGMLAAAAICGRLQDA